MTTCDAPRAALTRFAHDGAAVASVIAGHWPHYRNCDNCRDEYDRVARSRLEEGGEAALAASIAVGEVRIMQAAATSMKAHAGPRFLFWGGAATAMAALALFVVVDSRPSDDDAFANPGVLTARGVDDVFVVRALCVGGVGAAPRMLSGGDAPCVKPHAISFAYSASKPGAFVAWQEEAGRTTLITPASGASLTRLAATTKLEPLPVQADGAGSTLACFALVFDEGARALPQDVRELRAELARRSVPLRCLEIVDGRVMPR